MRLDHLLAGLVGRVCLAREDELHRMLAVGDDLIKLFQVGHQQIGTLVRRKTSCEADGQHVRVEHVPREFHHLVALAAAAILTTHATTHERQQQVLQGVVRFP